MSCVACESTETMAVRLGRSWCAACLDALEFEERVALANGTSIIDVAHHDGQVVYVFAQPSRDFSRAELAQIVIDRSAVLGEILRAARAFRESLWIVEDCVAGMSRHAPRLAREFIDVASKHEPLLAEDERRDLAHVLAMARTLAATVH